ncbi:helix-turn-helix transcriptional regulator [Streptomyces sp. NPDC051776]|uniref:helix-turn-helix transcriptional regulator n=1 Tax=Streptomyces sp. NPDC051776 TaxID=3155414 RepID=UPI00342B6F50
MRKARRSEDGEIRIHNRLAMLRAERGWSRRDLAEATGVNYQTIGYLERGDYNPSLELVFRICGCFGLPVEAVFSPRPFPRLTGDALTSGDSPAAASTPDISTAPEEETP